ncbi:squamosa promoter-binding-like protein 3 [Juglans microcarpa x Juglans regia]|uniref:squamosa promoter-binding-like protein 3 n=1 Tax=Juglans microcarpa x Juglans regia TaxID=2249226 RepID=UPI001B7EFE10|nr:squamosa promoter-binding-like protein 3 [Juglans microcarpa x Juglans regia]XP_041026602.1 squamosa promoter-binding-like protein 3 [Juglans microcarpa x Juglans regia]XP_041026603.1 squamosa promoter-binding-like protein 3 [Juglans microcarpa x Juglans regia]XP_041026605.1 squamosa promoter-binding-like protein 3 [Juglans microcarpa x Juglans regia]
MATSRAEGKRSFKYKAVEEEEEEEEEEEDDVGDLGFGEDEKKKQREMMTSSSKRAYGSGGSTPVVVCQVENCNADFADAKPYHRRHKVCELHAKAPAVHLHGLQKRFCQQCSRFHLLLEFDENKRSCRKRLAGHNERRRKSSSDVHGEGSH